MGGRAGMMTVLVPASNEAGYIGACLGSILSSDPVADAVEIIVIANGCVDATAAIARSFEPAALARGWRLIVLDLAEGGKLRALNAGDQAAAGDIRVYVDADVIVSPRLLADLCRALDRDGAAYASGALVMARPRGFVSRAYARFWARVPFMAESVPGCGVFAVNAAGRARWGEFPAIIADDAFVRLQFAPRERIGVPAPYQWPIVEGFSRLVKVRRRQDAGVREIERLYPELLANEDKPPFGPRRLLGLALSMPVGFLVYAAVSLAVRFGPASGEWSRGR